MDVRIRVENCCVEIIVVKQIMHAKNESSQFTIASKARVKGMSARRICFILQ